MPANISINTKLEKIASLLSRGDLESHQESFVQRVFRKSFNAREMSRLNNEETELIEEIYELCFMGGEN